MIVMNCHTRSSVLHFAAEYSLALPDTAVLGEGVPAALLLHDLGEGREQWLYGAGLQKLTEETGFAFVIPEGRRSCFQNMAEGPQWEDYLVRELLPAAAERNGLKTDACPVIGIGAGALGAFRLAADHGFYCAALEPVCEPAFAYGCPEWAGGEKEWAGVFKGREKEWDRALFAAARGVLVGSGQRIASAAKRLGLNGWKQVETDSTDPAALLSAAMRICIPENSL